MFMISHNLNIMEPKSFFFTPLNLNERNKTLKFEKQKKKKKEKKRKEKKRKEK